MAITSINPATGETLREYQELNAAAVEQKLATAARASRTHRQSSFSERAAILQQAADLLEQEVATFARTITLEMGKPIGAARDEVRKCAVGCRYYAENAERFLEEETIQTAAARSSVRWEPLGVVLAIMPWNFPFWQVFRFAAPALMAGNVGLLKHAANVPQCALAIEDIFQRAGAVDGVFQTLLIGSERVAALIADRRVAAVTLTGSERAGSEVAAAAGRAIKKCVLELGGSDPFIVMPGADLDAALTTAVKARTVNSGQSCIAAKRFFVAEAVYEEFVRRFVEKMQSLKSVIRSMNRPTSARSRRPRSGTACTTRCGSRSRRGRNCSPGENRPKGGETFILRRSWRRFRRKRRLIAKRSSARSRSSFAWRMRRRRLRWQMRAISDLARAFGRTIQPNRNFSRQN